MVKVYKIVVTSLFTTMLLSNTSFRLGVENIPARLKTMLQKKSVALITDRESTLCYLEDEGVSLRKVFAVTNLYDIDSVPVRTIEEMIHHGEQELADVDILLVDLTDFGLRNSPAVSALGQVLCSAVRYNKHVIILDRPNPLGCRMEGPLVEFGKRSQYAALPIPWRHGMTLGELAWFCNMHYLSHPAQLQVICMKGYSRDDSDLTSNGTFALLNLLKEVPSLAVSSTGKITVPSDESLQLWSAFSEALYDGGLAVECTRAYNSVTLSVNVHDCNKIASFKTTLYMLDFFKEHAVPLAFSQVFDDIVGTDKVRQYLEGTYPFASFASGVNDDLAYFYRKARPAFMYMPLPELCELNEQS